MKTNYALFLQLRFAGSLMLFGAIGCLAQAPEATPTGNTEPQDIAATLPTLTAQPLAQPFVSFHPPDGMILSTGNIYFTSHDSSGAHVFRTAQTSVPGQEIEIYHEPPGNRFGDIVFANVGGIFYGYFFAQSGSGATIKR